ncbi:Rrf2 family transcriptional regulator [Candidatus Parcubacteria bacterium]|nr:Rrf2 family transcriptional regulator [Candidatus Parcubacteria bacterium]MBI4385506.1 Rrf2 family transcriptional regulator [Candidatus Parcubacteria bacterium]
MAEKRSFLQLTTRGHYGLLLVAYCVEQWASRRPAVLHEVAVRLHLPYKYLEEIAGMLRAAGIVEAVRGPKGGYRLAHSPEVISVREVIEVLEGPIALVECLASPAGGQFPCRFIEPARCAPRHLLGRLQQAVTSALDGVTLRDFVATSRTPQRRKATRY